MTSRNTYLFLNISHIYTSKKELSVIYCKKQRTEWTWKEVALDLKST